MDELGGKHCCAFLRQVQQLAHLLWYIKDNSIYVRDGFLLVYKNKLNDGFTYKASLSEVFSYSNCEWADSEFSQSELMEAIKRFTPVPLGDYSEDEFGGKFPNSDYFFKTKGSDRTTRAMYFTLAARRNSILPMKILSYCTALECLFTIGTSEITHKIAECVAFMLGNSKESKKELYKLVKEAYNYRSAVVHGQHLKGSDEKLVPLSVDLDEILRQLFVNDYDIFSKNDEEIENYFMELLFS